MSNDYIPKIYLFRSGKLDKSTQEKVRNLTLNEKDIIVLFNKPSDLSIQYLLTEKYNKPVNYRFFRPNEGGFDINYEIYYHNTYNHANCIYFCHYGGKGWRKNNNKILQTNSIEKSQIINNTWKGFKKIDSDFSILPTVGLYSIEYMATKYPKSMMYLVGFTFTNNIATLEDAISVKKRSRCHAGIVEKNYVNKHYGDRTEIIL